jgi:methylenetetrahydrofolate dehydrogenase (NADP+)/methenyltetrahydrofolate cyclohydrolase
MVNLIDPEKDVDGLTTLNQGKLFSGEPGVFPCTPAGVLHLLRTVREDIAGLHAVILGRSSIVGRPLSQLLLNANCTVTLLHSYSKDLKSICKTADILVSAMGKPLFVGKEFVKPGALVIDVGVNRIEENGLKRIVGDVIFEEVCKIAGAITPVPNGVGPMTVAYLMHNTLNLACYH